MTKIMIMTMQSLLILLEGIRDTAFSQDAENFLGKKDNKFLLILVLATVKA